MIFFCHPRCGPNEPLRGGYPQTLPGLQDDPPPQLRVGDDEGRYGLGNTYIVILAETEEFADLGGALGAEALRVDDVGQARDIVVALLDDGERQNREVHANDAAADRLSLALARPAGTVARMALGEQEPDSGRVHDALLHGETLLVVSARDLEDVALELVADGIARNLGAHLNTRR